MLQRLKPGIFKSTVAHDSPIGSGATERRAPSVSRSKERVQVFDLTQATKRLNAIRTHGSSGSEFEQFMASLFAEAGFLVSAESTKDDRGVGLTLWLDEIAPVFKNPVLVELKTDLSRHGIWSHAADQLRRYLHTAGATCGVLVSLNQLPQDIPTYTPSLPMIVTFSAAEIVRLIATRDLGRELIRLHNAAVHGVS